MPSRTDIHEIEVATAYLAPFTRWSVNLVNYGPSWLPVVIRTVPLCLVAMLVKWHAQH